MLGAGVPGLGAQIEHGLNEDDFFDETGSKNIDFVDDFGNPIEYQITSNPGNKVGMAAFINLRVGTIVGFFLHDACNASGANAVYTVTDMKFGRLMDHKLTGAPGLRFVSVQPVVYAGPGIQTSPDGFDSDDMIFTLRLVE